MWRRVSNYVLDSYAILAYFGKENGADQVKELIRKARRREVALHLSLINLGEIYYVVYKNAGKTSAQSIINDTRRLPIKVEKVTDKHVWAAAEIKAQVSFSYADAFAASLAQFLNASLVTGDSEFRKLGGAITILWLP